MSLEWLKNPVHSIDNIARQDAKARQAILTKPVGSLGVIRDFGGEVFSMAGCSKARA